VTATPPEEDPPEREDRPDEEYARSYAEGYGEGLKEALRDVLQHASRGHTAQELRWLIESRLARVREEVELKRRSLLAPPSRPSWGRLLRAPQPTSPIAAPTLFPVASSSPLSPGTSLLVREERPTSALLAVAANWRQFPRLLLITLHEPNLPGVPVGRGEFVRPSAPGLASDARSGPSSASEVAGRIRTATEADGGALVYFDAVEFFVTEYTLDTTLKFVNWATTQMAQTASLLVVSLDPGTLADRDARRLQRSFTEVR
jgi:hypothetical protein